MGTRDYVVLLFGNGPDDPMFLQVKQELPSCYAPYLKDVKPEPHNGRRVAEGQQRMQTATDPFLGWTSIDGRDYLVRQLADRKAAIDPADLKGRKMLEYVTVCGETLAKAHARAGDPLAIAGYCGDTPKLDRGDREIRHGICRPDDEGLRRFPEGDQVGENRCESGKNHPAVN